MIQPNSSLAKTHPSLAKEWHSTRNVDLTPKDVTAGSGKKAWWKCPNGFDHEWEASIHNRGKNNGTGCPFCSGQKVTKSNCLATLHPKLAKEWHLTRNGNLRPENVTSGKSKKVWWQCSSDSSHEWQASIATRAKQSTGCPYCKGRKVDTSNCLAVTHPIIAKQWHTIKNGSLTSKDIIAGSQKKAWWRCPKGDDHEWQAIIGSVVKSIENSGGKGTACPVCRGLKVVRSNCLATIYPQLAKQWHQIRNGKLTSKNVAVGSHKKVWWKCPKGDDHEWQAIIKNRTLHNQACPVCKGLKVVKSNCLSTTHPKLAKEWHSTKNKNLKPENVSAVTTKKVWWKCSKGYDHEWCTGIRNRSGQKTGCPICSNQKIVSSNCLATTFPQLAKQWHPTKNGTLTPENVVAGTAKKVWWKCSKRDGHEWQAVINDRASHGRGCPFCNSIAVTHPQLAKQWHSTKNGKLIPESISAGSGRKVWWKCPKGSDHEWQAAICTRSKGVGCPICSNQKVVSSNCLATTFPQLAKQWHPTKNGNLTPNGVVAGSNKKVWWKCPKGFNHEWLASIVNRTSHSRGCPVCNSGWTIENIRRFVSSIKDNFQSLTPSELYILFQQSGLVTVGKGKSFVEALKTGKFPKEELEKFCKGEPSLVDDMANDPSLILEDHLEIDENIKRHEITEKELAEELAEKELPLIETKDVLAVLDSKVFSSVDEEAVEFFVTSGCAKIWKHVFHNENEATNQLKEHKGGKYPNEVKNRFLKEYNGAKKLKIPSGDEFIINKETIKANLMQRLVAYRVKEYQKQGNWSGTGAGKTLSAIIASRVINAKLTIVCCPNSVVEGWKLNIEQAYPDSVIHTKTLHPRIDQKDKKHHYLILNYEAFQQPNSEADVKNLTEKFKIDFAVIDEIHFSKQRVLENMSKRKKIITGLISNAAEKNSKLHVLGMSATPVINNLFEGISLLEMVTGVKYDDLNSKATVNNCMALYQRLSTIGIRWMPEYKQKLNIIKVPVDCSEYIDEINDLGIKHTMLDLEKILTKARLTEIKKHIKPKTLIYTHYVEEITKILKDEIEKDGWKVAFFTGEDKSGKKSFIEGNTDVLVASSSIGTGVDGLQKVCNRLIVNILPWTHAEFEQLKGRIYRQGQIENEVDIIIPLTKAEVNGEGWSWCESKWKRIQFKKSIADASVDGIVPEGHLRTPAQAYTDTMNWLQRLERGEINEIERRKIHIPLSDTTIKKRIAKYGDFSVMNNRMNKAYSTKTHERFQKDPKEWEQYHALYREAREAWTVVPYEEMINWCKARPDLVIGDFGCGEGKVAEALDNTVHSFDHIAINDSVIACDMTHVPLEDETLDVALFSLSLMGANLTEYLKEAHRCLKQYGHLHIIEATSRFSDIDTFTKGLEKLGFDVFKPEEKYKFTFIRALKSERSPKNIELKF